MPAYVIGNFFVYSLINAFTPGPGNILALNTVTNYGYKKRTAFVPGNFCRILCRSNFMRRLCVRAEQPSARRFRRHEIHRRSLYPVPGHSHCCQQAAGGRCGSLRLVFERLPAPIRQCKDLSFWDHGIDRLCHRLQHFILGALRLCCNEVHVADIRTCVLHPASETHRQLNEEQLAAAGIDGGMVRLSVGLEHTEDILADLEQAFSRLDRREVEQNVLSD